MKKISKMRKRTRRFPEILYQLIQENPSSISWDITGKKFKIKNVEKLELVLANYFRTNSNHSFT